MCPCIHFLAESLTSHLQALRGHESQSFFFLSTSLPLILTCHNTEKVYWKNISRRCEPTAKLFSFWALRYFYLVYLRFRKKSWTNFMTDFILNYVCGRGTFLPQHLRGGQGASCGSRISLSNGEGDWVHAARLSAIFPRLSYLGTTFLVCGE